MITFFFFKTKSEECEWKWGRGRKREILTKLHAVSSETDTGLDLTTMTWAEIESKLNQLSHPSISDYFLKRKIILHELIQKKK